MKNLENVDIEAVIVRLKQAFNVDSDRKLAEKLGTGSATIRNWKNRSQIPYQAIIVASIETNLDVKWLLYGQNSDVLDADSKQAFIQEFKKTIATGIQMELLSETDKTNEPNIEILGVHLFNEVNSESLVSENKKLLAK